jgi:hypothetical protein
VPLPALLSLRSKVDGGEVSARRRCSTARATTNTTSLFATVPDGRTLSSTNYGANGYAYGGEATTVYGGYGSSYGINMTAGDTGIVVFGQQQGVHSQAQFGAGVRADSAQGYGATAQAARRICSSPARCLHRSLGPTRTSPARSPATPT